MLDNLKMYIREIDNQSVLIINMCGVSRIKNNYNIVILIYNNIKVENVNTTLYC